MTRRRLLGQFGKAIEAAFTPYNLVPGPDDPPVLKVMSFEEFSHLQTEEIVRIGSKIVERFEQLFRLYCVARRGDDFCDFKSLALEMAIELFPDFRFKADPDLLELLFPLYGLLANGTCVFDYQLLVTPMADSCFSIKKQPNQSKPGNQLVLLWLLADVEVVQLARKRPRPYLDREAIKKLMGEEPFKARWGGMNAKTLCNWLSAARIHSNTLGSDLSRKSARNIIRFRKELGRRLIASTACLYGIAASVQGSLEGVRAATIF